MLVDRTPGGALTHRMQSLKGVSSFLLVLTVIVFSGCGLLKPEPEYMDVPEVYGVGEAQPVTSSFDESVGEAQPVTSSIGESQALDEAVSAPSEEERMALEAIVTPDETLIGSVVSVNQAGRFAVLRFPLGKMPMTGSKLHVYHQGTKVGLLNVTGPQRDDHTVADIVSGTCQSSDEVRDQ